MSLPGWSGIRVEITIPASGVDADLTDFPVNLLLSAAAGIGDADLGIIFTEISSDANRKKIAVTKSDGTQCYVDIERWDNASSKASLHVKIPFISSSVDTVLYLYADATHTDNTTYVGDSGDAVAENVWDSNYEAVYHFAQDPSGGGAQLIDSTSNSNDGTSQGTMTSGDLVDAGVDSIQKAWDLEGTDDYIDAGVPLVIGANQDFTFEIFSDQSSNIDRALWSTARGNGTPGNAHLRGHIYGPDDGGASGMQLVGSTTGGASYFHDELGSATANPELHTFIRTGGTFKLAIDDDAPDTKVTTTASFDNSENTYLGQNNSSDYFNGHLIEARISSIARSTEWYQATYKTLYDAFVTYDLSTTGNANITLPALVMIGDRNGDLAASLPLLESTGASGWTGEANLPVLSSYSEAYIDHIESANVTLPSLTVEMISGASLVSELEPLSLAASGLHAYPFFGDSILPALTVDAIPGMIGAADLGAVAFTGSGLQGVVGGVNEFLPKLIIDAYLNIVQHGVIDVRMKRLLLEATATVGSAYNLSLIYPRLTLQIEAVFGTIGSINTNLPAIKETGLNSYNDIIGNMTGELSI